MNSGVRAILIRTPCYTTREPNAMPAKRDYYDVLGVSRTASADEIRKAHRKLARQFHPDMNKNNASATEKFKEVQEAYDVLSDGERRRMYDQVGHSGPRAGPPPGASDPFEAFRRAGGTNGGAWRAGNGGRASPDDFGGQAGFEGIFEELFGGRARGGRGGGGNAADPFGAGGAEAPIRGADIEHAVQLTFEQAARGTSVPLRFQVGGQSETIDLKIPAGVNDGSKIRLKGKGQPGPAGHGDLFIVCKVAPHPTLRREGLDVQSDVNVPVYDAMLGGKVAVQTLDGEVTLTIPPGTGSGAKLRIKGRGITRGAEQGDHFAVVKITLPKELSPEAKELVEQLRQAAPVR